MPNEIYLILKTALTSEEFDKVEKHINDLQGRIDDVIHYLNMMLPDNEDAFYCVQDYKDNMIQWNVVAKLTTTIFLTLIRRYKNEASMGRFEKFCDNHSCCDISDIVDNHCNLSKLGNIPIDIHIVFISDISSNHIFFHKENK